MTPEAQRIAIAEHLGWKWYRWGGQNLFLCTPARDWSGGSFVPAIRKPGEKFRADKLPDYLNDLNAMHEAEKVLDGRQCWKYEKELLATYGDSFIWKATAAQRAEAFLRTLNLWTETPEAASLREGEAE